MTVECSKKTTLKDICTYQERYAPAVDVKIQQRVDLLSREKKEASWLEIIRAKR